MILYTRYTHFILTECFRNYMAIKQLRDNGSDSYEIVVKPMQTSNHESTSESH